MSDAPESDDPGNENGTVLDGPNINDEVVGVDYQDPADNEPTHPVEGPPDEPPPPAAPAKSKPAPEPAPEPASEPEPA